MILQKIQDERGYVILGGREFKKVGDVVDIYMGRRKLVGGKAVIIAESTTAESDEQTLRYKLQPRPRWAKFFYRAVAE